MALQSKREEGEGEEDEYLPHTSMMLGTMSITVVLSDNWQGLENLKCVNKNHFTFKPSPGKPYVQTVQMRLRRSRSRPDSSETVRPG